MDESTADLLMGAARSLRRRFAAAIKEYDVTPAQARALRAIAERPGLRLATLADALRMVPRSVTEVVDALESRGLVSRRPDPGDRRATLVALTPAGTTALRTIEQIRLREVEAFLAVLSGRDRASLDRILRQLR